jgi:hypothetical protein
MGFPVQHIQRTMYDKDIPEDPQVSPATLALLSRSLPPDRLRILLTTLFSTMTSRQQQAVGHVIVNTIPANERVTDLLQPRRVENGSTGAIPAERIWANDQVEKSLAEGTAFNLVPALSIPRAREGGQSGPANLRWVWRSSTGTVSEGNRGIRASGSTQTERTLDRSAFAPSGANRTRLGAGMRPRPEQVSLMARDIEQSIFQGLADEITQIYSSSPDSDSSSS